MNIYNRNGVEILEVEVDDNSLRNRVIMGDHNLTLHYSLAVHVELPVGSYCTFDGITYTLKRPENLKMKHSRNFEYTVLLESPQADTKIWKFRNTVDGRLKFPLTAKPHEHLQMLVDNLNRRGSGWTVGDCVDDVEHLICYDHDYCWDALSKMATEFSTEFEIDNKRISLKKVEYNKNAPLALSYGKGNGFRTGVARSSSETPPVEFLFVQGGSENIDRSQYGSDRAANGSPVLLLPKSKTIKYDGEHFEDEVGYNASKARTYSTDNYGLCIFRTDKAHTSYAEDSLDCSDVCPKRVGTVSSVVTVDAEHNFYDIVDASIPDGLDYSACQIEGEKLTIIFQSGMLAGHGEFEVNYFHTAVNGKAAKRFEIVPKDEDGITMPNATFKPVGGVNGDKYAVFKCMLPDAYICDNNTKSGAEWDMFRTAVKYMYAHEEEEFSFKGELDSIWASQDWANIGAKIILGGYVQFSDTRFQPNGVLVRITGIKDYINKPHKPEIELSNKTVTAGFASEIKQIESQEVITEEYHRDALDFTKRRFRDAKETMDMLNDLIEAGFDNFTGNINPITVQTMQMLVGDESLQYRFVNNTTNPSTVNHTFSWNNATKKLSTAAGIIQHMTIGIKNLSSSHAASEYKYWSVSAFESAALTDGSKKYYLYIKASKTEATAVFLLSETAIRIEQVTGYYHFLVGVLNSEYEDGRSFVTLYGFSEILPGRITTDRVVSSSGTSFFDLVANALKLGDKLDFNTAGDGKLVLKGTLVQSLDGETEQPVGCYRGQWDEELMYYYGDEVWYNSNGVISYYRYINQTPTIGNAPTNTTYWQVLAAGVRGNYFEYRYAVNGSPTSYPSISRSSRTPSGWSKSPSSQSALQYLWMTVAEINGETDALVDQWSVPVRHTPLDGVSTGENLVDNSEEAEIFEVVECGLTQDSTPPQKFYQTKKRLCRIPADGTVLSGQVRITLTGCSFKSGGAQVLVYLNGSAAWPAIGEKLSITANGTYDLKNEAVTFGYNSGTMYKPIFIRLRNFNTGGTITVERVKVEVGSRCSDWSLSEADKRGPAILYQGVYDSTSTYYGTRDRIDCVKYNDVYYAVRSDAGAFAGIVPTNSDYWNEFGGQFSSVATQLLLAEFAYIENLGVRNLLTSDSGKRVHVSKDENALSIYDENGEVAVVMSGDEYSDGDLFGGTETSLSPTSFSGSYRVGNELHPDMEYTSGYTTNKSFTVTKASVLSGSVSLNISCSGTYSMGSSGGQLKPTRMAQAQVEVYLDNTMLGSCSIGDLKPDLMGNSPSNSMTIYINKNLTIGSHVLKTRVKISNPNYATANYAVSASSSFSSIKVKYDIRKSHYFANGNALGCSSTQYSETIIQNSAILHKVRSGNAGMEINGGTFKILLGGTWYTASMTTVSGEKVLKLTNV